LHEILHRWKDRWELRRRIDEELRFHYQEALDVMLDEGLPPDVARREAAFQVGDRRAAAEACLAVWDDGPQSYPRPRAGRAVMAAAAIAGPALLALALLPHYFRPLPAAGADALYVSAKRFQQAADLAREAPEDVASFRRAFASIGWSGSVPQRVTGQAVSTNFFRLQGVAPARGPGFSTEEAREIVLSDALWRSAFAGDPDIVGRAIQVEGKPAVVAGVAAPDFWFLNKQDRFWMHQPDVHGKRPEATALLRLYGGRLRDEAWARFPELDLLWVPLGSAARVSLRGAAGVAAGAMLLLALLGLVQAWSLVRALGFGNVSVGLLGRNYVFLFAKAAPPIAVAGILWMALQDSALLSPAGMLGGVLSFVAAFVYALAAVSLAWRALVDQRLRCHVCLRRLSMPLAQGVFGSILFNLPATEYICAWGHGTLYVPEPTSEGVREPRWTEPGGLWAQLMTDRRPTNA
jgi:hypothetical protein